IKGKKINEGTEAKIYEVKGNKSVIIRESKKDLRIKIIAEIAPELTAEIIEEGEGYAVIEKLREIKFEIPNVKSPRPLGILEDEDLRQLCRENRIIDQLGSQYFPNYVGKFHKNIGGNDCLFTIKWDSFIQVSHRLNEEYTNKIFDLLISETKSDTKKFFEFMKKISKVLRDNDISNIENDLGPDNVGKD